MNFVDFAELKSRVNITQVLEMLGIELKPSGQQLRGLCPIHNGNNPRGFVVTPEKGVWYCFGDCGKGGDLIELYARVKEVSTKDAAIAIATRFGLAKDGKKDEKLEEPKRNGTLKPLDYLVTDHESLKPLNLASATLSHFGAGFAPRGIMRGRLAIPIHDAQGVLIAYVGVAVAEGQEPRLLYPKDFDPSGVIFNAHRAQAGVLNVTRDPLTVLTAYENGIENVVAVLSDITAPQVERLASLMKLKAVEALELV